MLWIATEGGGTSRFSLDRQWFTHFRHQPGRVNGLPHASVRAFAPDDDGTIWIGTAAGLARWDSHTETFGPARPSAPRPERTSTRAPRPRRLALDGHARKGPRCSLEERRPFPTPRRSRHNRLALPRQRLRAAGGPRRADPGRHPGRRTAPLRPRRRDLRPDRQGGRGSGVHRRPRRRLRRQSLDPGKNRTFPPTVRPRHPRHAPRGLSPRRTARQQPHPLRPARQQRDRLARHCRRGTGPSPERNARRPTPASPRGATSSKSRARSKAATGPTSPPSPSGPTSSFPSSPDTLASNTTSPRQREGKAVSF